MAPLERPGASIVGTVSPVAGLRKMALSLRSFSNSANVDDVFMSASKNLPYRIAGNISVFPLLVGWSRQGQNRVNDSIYVDSIRLGEFVVAAH
jgi:hypothetical protein